MSIPAVLNVVENEETVQVCATINTQFIDTVVNVTVTLSTSDGTGIIL